MGEFIKKINKQKAIRIALLVLADIILINLSAFMALYIRFELDFRRVAATAYFANIVKYAPVNTIITIVVFVLANLYNSMWEFAGSAELLRMCAASVFTSALNWFIMRVVELRMPRSYPILFAILLIAMCGFMRYSYRAVREMRRRGRRSGMKRTMIIGGGSGGAMALREFQYSDHSENRVVCIIDDDTVKQGSYLHGVKIVGGRNDIPDAVKRYDVEEIVLAMPSVPRSQRRSILDICRTTGVRTMILPGIYQLASGEVRTQTIRDVDIEDLLGRDAVDINLDEVKNYISGKVVLVTGGGGSIGSELCRQAANFGPKQLIIFDIYENNAYYLQQELKRTHPDLDLVVLIGSVRDKTRIDNIFRTYRPDIVCHAAAHKHVPLVEASPFEAVKNNIYGTYNVASAADRYGTGRFILISSDKAVNPTNVMGASKRVCEMIVQMMNDRSDTEYVAVRFGNVLGSAGSIIPLFRQQISAGGPVTVTDKRIIRYFMTIREAVQLIFQAGAYAKGGEIFVLDMGDPVSIDELARNMIRLSGFEPDTDIPIVYTGLRPGEKLYEELLLSGEGIEKTKNDLIYIGHEVEFDKAGFEAELEKLGNIDEDDLQTLYNEMARIVPTYKRDADRIAYAEDVKEA